MKKPLLLLLALVALIVGCPSQPAPQEHRVGSYTPTPSGTGFVHVTGGVQDSVAVDGTTTTTSPLDWAPAAAPDAHAPSQLTETSTTDATVTTAASFTQAAETAVDYTATVMARSDTGLHFRLDLRAAYSNTGGAFTTLDTPSTTAALSAGNPGGWAAVFDQSGSAVRVRVTGAAATNVRWSVVANAQVIKYTVAAGAPTVSSVAPAVADTAGGGGLVTITGTNFTGSTAVTLGATACTSFTVVNSTTITCTPAARTAGASLSILVTNTAGTNTANTLFEYWTPAQVTGISSYLDANKGVTGGASVSAWVDQSSNAFNFVQATGAQKPAQTASVFGSLPSIRFAGAQWVSMASAVTLASGHSMFFVGKTTGTTFTAGALANVAGVVVGQNNGSAWGSFGFDGTTSPNAKAEYTMYDSVGSTHPVTDRGTGFSDGTTRLLGVTSDTTPNVKIYSGVTQQGATNSPSGGYDTVHSAYQTVGAGSSGNGAFTGDIGAVVVVQGVISGGDLTKLNAWSQQRWATP